VLWLDALIRNTAWNQLGCVGVLTIVIVLQHPKTATTLHDWCNMQ